MKKVAINGFGRIGRLVCRRLLEMNQLEVVAINDLTNSHTLAHLFKYDSAHGRFPGTVESSENQFTIDGKSIEVFSKADPADLPWKELGIDLVLECTGVFRTREKASKHIEAGAKRVLLSAPAKGGDVDTIVLGVNDGDINPKQTVFSNASCTTNCLAPVAKIVHENWSIIQGTVLTVHAYTADQNIQDAPHSDLRRARAAAFNIVPTSTGAAKATEIVYPPIKDKLHATAVRVPVITGSLIELTCWVEEKTNPDQINAVFKEKSNNELKGILEYTEDPIVSSDIVQNPHASIFDAELTVVEGNMAKVVSWYDNEAGYSARLADLAKRIANLPSST